MPDHGEVRVSEDRSGGQHNGPQTPDAEPGDRKSHRHNQGYGVATEHHLALQFDDREQQQRGPRRAESERDGQAWVRRGQPSLIGDSAVSHHDHEPAKRESDHNAYQSDQVRRDQVHHVKGPPYGRQEYLIDRVTHRRSKCPNSDARSPALLPVWGSINPSNSSKALERAMTSAR